MVHIEVQCLTQRNALASAYGEQGDITRAEELFKQMKHAGVKPDVITWYICSLILHTGMH